MASGILLTASLSLVILASAFLLLGFVSSQAQSLPGFSAVPPEGAGYISIINSNSMSTHNGATLASYSCISLPCRETIKFYTQGYDTTPPNSIQIWSANSKGNWISQMASQPIVLSGSPTGYAVGYINVTFLKAGNYIIALESANGQSIAWSYFIVSQNLETIAPLFTDVGIVFAVAATIAIVLAIKQD